MKYYAWCLILLYLGITAIMYRDLVLGVCAMLALVKTGDEWYTEFVRSYLVTTPEDEV